MAFAADKTRQGAAGQGGFELDQSLRFDDGDSPYLSKTPASAGNRKTFTFSAWVKRSKIGGQETIFAAYGADNNLGYNPLIFSTGNQLGLGGWSANWLMSTALFRDASAWYHIVLAVDTTDSTANDRIKLYVNGTQLTDFATRNNPSLNDDFAINNAVRHDIGARAGLSGDYLDAYLSEVHFIDGTALTPTSFGETGDYGEWKPKQVSGLTYGTNGFYLPFKQDYTVEGFSTVLYKGNGVDGHYIGGTGFSPDLTWIKARDQTYSPNFYDTVRGTSGGSLGTDGTAVEAISHGKIASQTDGFTTLTGSSTALNNNGDGAHYVAWCWDMGGSNATNTEGTITSTVRANATYGQSIVSYVGTGANATVGHGLSSAPEMIIQKNRDEVQPWWVYLSSIGAGGQLRLNTTHAEGSDGDVIWNSTTPTSSVFSVGTNTGSNGSLDNCIAYCFHSVTGYSSFGSYTGDGTTDGSKTISLGFKPAFVLIKRTDALVDWKMFDNARNPSNPVTKILQPNLSDAEGTYDTLEFNDTSFGLLDAGGAINTSSEPYIYAAFADKREYAYWLDQSGNNNDWTSNNLTESDISVDSPTNNFATFNPVQASHHSAVTLSEGNLHLASSVNYHGAISTLAANSGKWYWEVYNVAVDYSMAGFTTIKDYQYISGAASYAQGQWFEKQSNAGEVESVGTTSLSGGSQNIGYTLAGDIMQFALDLDNGRAYVGKNGTWSCSANPATGTNYFYGDWYVAGEYYGVVGAVGTSAKMIMNFGQDSSFAGRKTAQGNQDGNDIGDFYYTPPTGYLALCTSNLPDVAVIPSEHFNTITYDGDGATGKAITGVGFSPSLVWVKETNLTAHHVLHDAVRGPSGGRLSSNRTNAEDASTSIASFDSDGYTVGSSAAYINSNSAELIAWNWKANGSGSSNTAGSINSTVSVNTDAGFSIVGYAGTGSAGTVGHGLSKAPEMIWVKNRSKASQFAVYFGDNTDYVALSDNDAQADYNQYWNDTSPTSTVFSVGSDGDVHGASGENVIAYCFHSVDGYSKVGSYTGNSSTDGAFIYTGFRPAYVMSKGSSDGGQWNIQNNKSNPYNVINKTIFANDSVAEYTDPAAACLIDFTSNGFKWRNNDDANNYTGRTYIYIAFAETPFKYANAR